MESNKLNIPLKYWIIAGVIAVVLLSGTLGSLWENKGLKDAIKYRDSKIEQINKDKADVIQSIKEEEKVIKTLDSVILVLSQKQKDLERTNEYLKYENERIKKDYSSRSISERVILFSKLATRNDSTQ